MVQRIAAPITPSIKVLQNRIYMPTQPQYQDTSGSNGAFNPSGAKTLLQQSNMTMGSHGYFQPNFGPEKGKDLTFSISTTSGVPARRRSSSLPGRHEGHRRQDQHPELQRQHAVRHGPPQGRVRPRLVRLGGVAVRLAEPVHRLLLHQHRELRPEL